MAERNRIAITSGVVLGALLIGGLDGALYGKKPELAIVIASASLAAATGVVVGLAVWAVATLAAAAERRVAWLGWPRRALAGVFDAEDSPELRSRWLTAYASLVAVAAVTAAGFGATRLVFNVLFGLQEQTLARWLATLIVAVLFVILFVVQRVLTHALAAALLRIDRRRRVPLPPPRWLVWAFIATLPAFLGLFPLLRKYGGMLGRIQDVAALALLLVLAIQLVLLVPPLRRRLSAAVDLLVLALAIAALLGVASPGPKRRVALARAETNSLAGLGARMARALTDFDRDGASALFGGGDCAPNDPTRAPGKVEIPNNKIDEDCDGSDGFVDVELGVSQRFSERLSPEQVGQYNVVWVIMETVRADHVSAFGYDKPTMPFLEELSKESLLFENATSQASATVLSVPSMLTGMDPGAITWRRERQHPQVDPSIPMLAERLKKRRYKTGFVYDNYIKNAFTSIHRGFDQLLLAEPDNNNQNNRPRRNPIATAKAAEFLGKIGPGEPFFLVVYFPDQHSPYTRHPDVDSSAFDPGELGDYDTELAFADQQLRALIGILKARPAIWDKTIVVINADHGEEFGEHDGIRHAKTCYIESLHVPLVVRIPGIEGARIAARVGLIDVVPTLLEMIGARDDTQRLSGQSLLVPALAPEKVDPDRPLFCSIASITDKYGTFFRRAVRDGQLTLVHDLVSGQYGLFDHVNDPFEQANLGLDGVDAPRAQKLLALLARELTGNLADHRTMNEKLGIKEPPPQPKAPKKK